MSAGRARRRWSTRALLPRQRSARPHADRHGRPVRRSHRQLCALHRGPRSDSGVIIDRYDASDRQRDPERERGPIGRSRRSPSPTGRATWRRCCRTRRSCRSASSRRKRRARRSRSARSAGAGRVSCLALPRFPADHEGRRAALRPACARSSTATVLDDARSRATLLADATWWCWPPAPRRPLPAAEDGRRAFEYRHTPDPGEIDQVLLPMLGSIRGAGAGEQPMRHPKRGGHENFAI